MKVLVVDDDKSIALNLIEVLDKKGYTAKAVFTGEKAIEESQKNKCDIALVDMLLPDMDGIHVLDEIKKNSPKTVVIMITAFGTISNAVDAVKKGADRKSTRLNSSHTDISRMPSSA